MEPKAEWLETILKRNSREKRIERVMSAVSEPAVGKGENYCSAMTRVTLRAVLGSGDIVTRSVIVKAMPESEKERQFLIAYAQFNIEIWMYTTVFPQMNALMEEHGDTGDKLYCDCLGYRAYDQIVLEDLKVQGFRNGDRKAGLDLEHALLVVRNLARVHAMSVVLLHRGKIQVNHLKPYLLARNDPVFIHFINTAMTTLIDVMRKTWDSKWQKTADNLEELSRTCHDKLELLGKRDDSKFNVLCHGDCWTNNMLFKYDQISQKPISMRLVDFQIPHYNSYAFDLTYFLYSSVRPDVRRESRTELLSAYRRTLETVCRKHRHAPENVPSAEDVEAEMGRLGVARVAVACALLPLTTADAGDAVDLEVLTGHASSGTSDEKTWKTFTSPLFTASIQNSLMEFVDDGLL